MPVSATRPPVSAFSNWSSALSSPSSDSFDDERILYPLSRPTSSASLQETGPYQPIPDPASRSASTATPSSSVPPSSGLSSPFPAHQVPKSAVAFSLPSPPSTSPPPATLYGAFIATTANVEPSPPSSPAADAMGFSFLRRSASVTDLPAIPSETQSDSYIRSRQFYTTPVASASTNDLPSLFTSPHAPSPPPLRAPPMVRTGPGGAIGPKAGARLLASKEGQRALRKADELGEANGGEEFSIRQRVPLREDRGLSTVTGSVPSEMTEHPDIPPARRGSSSGSRTRSGSNSTGVRRVPVPALDLDSFLSWSEKAPAREGGIQELTSRASQEEQKQDEDAARRRQASLSKASSAGLASPFAIPAKPDRPALEIKKRRVPPIAGLNKNGLPALNEQGRNPSGALGNPRQRCTSSGSTASMTKEVVLAQLGEAIKREKKKAEMYEREFKQSENELAEIDRNLDVLKEKFATTLEQQKQVIQNLETEIEEVKAELERVNDLDEETAQEYLALLSSTSIDTLKARDPFVTAFNPNALTSSPEMPTAPGDTVGRSKFSALAFRRGLSLKRRVDTHIATYDTVASNIAVPKPPLVRSPPRTDPVLSATVPEPSQPRPRKLSKVRLRRAASQEAISAPVSPPQTATPARPPPETPAPGFAARPTGPNSRAAPPPAPVFPTASSPFPSSSAPDDNSRTSSQSKNTKQKRPPPVSGVSRSRIFGGLVGPASDSETDNGGVNGRQEPPGVPRKRSNSLTKTLRIFFPSNAPKQEIQQPSQQVWLRSDRADPEFNSR
ncbi:hypothetical protein JCM11251_002321 [Rhodosporidiobolus azoricus]